jgi:hypothetical protein
VFRSSVSRELRRHLRGRLNAEIPDGDDDQVAALYGELAEFDSTIAGYMSRALHGPVVMNLCVLEREVAGVRDKLGALASSGNADRSAQALRALDWITEGLHLLQRIEAEQALKLRAAG